MQLLRVGLEELKNFADHYLSRLLCIRRKISLP